MLSEVPFFSFDMSRLQGACMITIRSLISLQSAVSVHHDHGRSGVIIDDTRTEANWHYG